MNPETQIAHAAAIVQAYVGNHHVLPDMLPSVMRLVHRTLEEMRLGETAPAAPAIAKPTPAEIRKSITPDALISFIDGKPYKTLKRHLTSHGHTPQSYRAAYGLPADYPVTAASYSVQRSALAKQIGLGVPGARAAGPALAA